MSICKSTHSIMVFLNGFSRWTIVLIIAFITLESLAQEIPEKPDTSESHWLAGTGRARITPETPIWMSGYASRTSPAEGKRVDLWAKALSISDADSESVILITLDLVGMSGELSLKIRSAIANELQLCPDRIILCFSHTHTGPVVGGNLKSMYFLNPDQWLALRQYEEALSLKIKQAALDSWASRSPSKLSWATGQATFGVNRRNNNESQVPELREKGLLVGPVDYSVPTLAVRNLDHQLTAVVFGYACHSTTLSDLFWSGDYPGFAQIELESHYPETQAMFWAGCGADINPLPRRKPELAQNYGRQLAESVLRSLNGVMFPLSPDLSWTSSLTDLPFESVPDRNAWEEQALSTNRYIASRAEFWLEELEAGGEVPDSYPYPLVGLKLGSSKNGLNWIFMGGEVVVDYAIRAREQWGEDHWITAYAQDVMGYIPSRRVWDEGGYEGDSSAIYYGLPSRWSSSVEDLVWERMSEVLRRVSE